MLFYRRKMASILLKVPLPALATSLVVSIPLIILEEQIDCMPAWCGQVLIPPTLPFLFVEVLTVALIALRFHSKNPIRVASVYSIFGVLWEVLFGGLVGAPILIALVFAPYVWIGYAFISLLPFSILLAKRNRGLSEPADSVGPQLASRLFLGVRDLVLHYLSDSSMRIC